MPLILGGFKPNQKNFISMKCNIINHVQNVDNNDEIVSFHKDYIYPLQDNNFVSENNTFDNFLFNATNIKCEKKNVLELV